MAQRSCAITFVVRYHLVDARPRTVVLGPRVWSQFGAWRTFATELADATGEDSSVRAHALTILDDLTCIAPLLSRIDPAPLPRVYRTSVESRATMARRRAHALYEAALDCAQLAVRWRLDAGGRLRQRLRHVTAEAAAAFVPWCRERIWPDDDPDAVEAILRVALEAGVDLRDDGVQTRVGTPVLDDARARRVIEEVARESPLEYIGLPTTTVPLLDSIHNGSSN